MSQEKFFNFLTTIGVRKETAVNLWNGNIHSPQELASVDESSLTAITNDPVLLNTLLPVLRKYAYPITMAADPYAKALKLLKQHSGDGDAAATQQSEQIQSDAVPFPTTYQSSSANRIEPAPRNPAAGSGTTRVFQGVNMKTRQTENAGNGQHLAIFGGNFPQSNIMGSQPVIYNNTNTTVSATSYGGDIDRQALRSEKLYSSIIKMQDCTYSTSQFFFSDQPDYWSDDTPVRTVPENLVQAQRNSDDLYCIPEESQLLALLINVTEFRGESKVNARRGADVDTAELRQVLTQLGFTVTVCLNKTKSEIEQQLREFANSTRRNCAVSLVFIGSHGERVKGEDRFMGVNQQLITAQQVVEQFNGTNCPSMREKPKLFFFQFCRGDNTQQQKPPSSSLHSDGIQSDATGEIEENVTEHYSAHDDADMLHSFATAAGTKAYRDTNDGSWYVTALCKVLKEQAHSDDLLTMMTKVNNVVLAKKEVEVTPQTQSVAVQLTTFNSTLRKKVRFFPQ